MTPRSEKLFALAVAVLFATFFFGCAKVFGWKVLRLPDFGLTITYPRQYAVIQKDRQIRLVYHPQPESTIQISFVQVDFPGMREILLGNDSTRRAQGVRMGYEVLDIGAVPVIRKNMSAGVNQYWIPTKDHVAIVGSACTSDLCAKAENDLVEILRKLRYSN